MNLNREAEAKTAGVAITTRGDAITIRVAEVTPYLRRMTTRMPFRFGNTVMTGMPILHLRVRMETAAGESFYGCSACGIASMWFDKDYTKSEGKREGDLCYSTQAAIEGYVAAGSGSAWRLHETVEPSIRKRLEADGLNGLTAGYGIALVDAAIIDGICRNAGLSFFETLKAGLLGFDERIAAALQVRPAPSIALRHTIGLGDPFTESDVTEKIGDGLPQTLEEVIATYNARYFKIKVNNNVSESVARLERIASILDASAGDYEASLDGNEAFANMDSFLEFMTSCAAAPTLRALWERVLWIEQPVSRHAALEPSVARPLKKVSALKPVIIDESDSDDAVLDRALALGYAGISAKNCKGVYRTLRSYLTIQQRGGVLSSEDLTNQPIVSNHQDLCLAAALGIRHSERNGHHFFRSFDYISEKERQQTLQQYPSLYEKTNDGVPTLRISNGEMSMREINAAHGFGVVSEPDWDSMEQIALPTRVQE